LVLPVNAACSVLPGVGWGDIDCSVKRIGLVLLALWSVALPVLAATNATVCVVTVRDAFRDDMINHNSLFLVRRALHEAAAQRAAALVLELDTNGGRVDATEDIMRLLQHAPMKTITFVNQKAYSAGAFIAAATDKIYMAPGSVIGAATPVVSSPEGAQELPKAYQEKISSAVRALVRTAAQQNGHDPLVFEAMIDADIEVTKDGKVISEKGKLLTLTDQEAAAQYGEPPKPLVSAGTVNSIDELLAREGLAGARTFTVEQTGFEMLGRWLTAVGPLLITIGFIAIYIEMKTPGIGLPAAVAALCFGLYFFGNFAAGLAGWEDVVLFGLGVVLLIVEIFVLPGFGVVGIAGIALILISLVMGMVQRLPGGPILPSWPDVEIPIIKVILSFGGSVIVMALLARFLPETRFFKRLELSATSPTPPAPTGQPVLPVGAEGVAETQLRPAGKGRFGDRLVDVVTEGDLVPRGEAIRVLEVNGARVVVGRKS